jgi:hypothetical protein
MNGWKYSKQFECKTLIGCPVLGFLLAEGSVVGFEAAVIIGVVIALGVSVDKMTTINEQAVDLSLKSSNAKQTSGSSWEGGNEMLVEMVGMVSSFHRPNLSGGFSPIGRKKLEAHGRRCCRRDWYWATYGSLLSFGYGVRIHGSIKQSNRCTHVHR